jgi:hypothetical protein
VFSVILVTMDGLQNYDSRRIFLCTVFFYLVFILILLVAILLVDFYVFFCVLWINLILLIVDFGMLVYHTTKKRASRPQGILPIWF